MDTIDGLRREVINCTRCPRLVQYLEVVARTKRRMYRDQEYWGRPLPGFGDPKARVLVVGLAPAAHGGNRTGRMFTGDGSGNWLIESLFKYGFSNQPTSRRPDDGLELRDAYITAAIRCAPPANKPLREELLACRPYLLRELGLLSNVSVVVALGKIGFDAYLAACRELDPRGGRPSSSGETGGSRPLPAPRFAHGATYALPNGTHLVASYHPSQQNTQTGRLTRDMFEGVFATVRRLLDHA